MTASKKSLALTNKQGIGFVISLLMSFLYGCGAMLAIHYDWMNHGFPRLLLGLVLLSFVSGLANAIVWCDLAHRRKRFYFGGSFLWLILFWLPSADLVIDRFDLYGFGAVVINLSVILGMSVWIFVYLLTIADADRGL